jgi:hypothetical protein
VSAERRKNLPPRVQAAIAELQDVIARRYPDVTFEVSRGEDEPDNIHLTAIVDVDDTDEVLDLVIDRVVELQVGEGIPVHVIPIRTPERVLASTQSQAKARASAPG